MGIAIPQVVTEDRASGALVVDGSLKFQSVNKDYLSQTIDNGTSGFTLSLWMKPFQTGNRDEIFDTVASTGFYIYRHTDGSIRINNNSTALFTSNGLYRDTNAFYHIVFSYNSTAGYGTLWVNGRVDKSTTFATQLYAGTAKISSEASSDPAEYSLAQWYLIDGLALGPSYFAYTDPLTNTWRPKKFKAEGTTLNNGTVWSSNITGATNPTNGFNGSLSNYMVNTAGGTPMVLTASFKNVNSFRYYTGNSSAHDISFNGEPAIRDAASAGWRTVSAPSSINSISWIHSNTGATAQVNAVEINGEILIDSTTTNLDFGTNGFYLPMDGNSSIGEDKSGKGNNWKLVNFGGSAALDKATGAKPILNTLPGGTIATPGVFGSKAGAQYTTTSATNSGGKYVFENEGTQPTFSFIRGATYTFDYNASTGHPLRFATAADAAGSTQYTDGTSVSGNVISFTVPHNAPNTLRYYCTNHSGMGNSISVTTDETKADPYAWKCTLAIPFINDTSDHSGEINCTVSSKTTSSDNLTFSTPGDMFYGSPAKLLGNGSSNSRVLIASGAFGFGTGDFTIEFWGHFTATGDQGNRNARILTAQSESGEFVQILSATSTAKMQFDNNHIPNTEILNKTRHYVYQRTGTTCQLIVDGVLYDSDAQSRNFADVAYQIGRFDASNGGASLYMVDFRVYTGVQKYPNSGLSIGDPVFIPASISPDILPDTPSGVSGSSKLAKIPDSITEGAVVFDGSGDYLRVEHADMAMGTGDFTAEAFIYNSVHRNYVNYIGTRESGQGDAAGWCIASNAGGDLYVYSAGLNTNLTIKMATKRWYHVAYTRESGTHKWYVNGVLQGSDSSSRTYTDDTLTIGANSYAGSEPVDGFISNVRVIKGTALYTSNFTPPTRALTNVTNTKLLCCQSNTSAIAAAVTPVTITAAGNAAASTFSPFNTDINTVRGQKTGYCTFNPLIRRWSVSADASTISNGNFRCVFDNDNQTGYAFGSMLFPSTGKFYFETFYVSGDAGELDIGVGPHDNQSNVYSYLMYKKDGNKRERYAPGGDTTSSYGETYAPGDTIGCAVDVNGDIEFFKNGITQGVAFSGISIGGTWGPFFFGDSYNGTSPTIDLNTGQKPFKFPPPAGFQPLNAANVRPETVIARPDQYFSTKLYTGNQSVRTISTGNTPDLVWIKDRDDASHNHNLIDTVRGAPRIIQSDTTADEITDSTDGLTSFTSNGFTLGANTLGNQSDELNKNGNDYVAWAWKAGGNKGTWNKDDVAYASAAAAGLDGGTINPTGASVGTKQGFSIIKYTGNSTAGATVAHGLSQTPDFVVLKQISGTDESWRVRHAHSGDLTKTLYLNGNAANSTNTEYISGASATTITLSSSANGINSGSDYIVYSWHSVPGLQKFGKYIGNNNPDGPFIELGFRPSLIIIKRSDGGTENWTLWDASRNPENVMGKQLYPNLSAAEADAGTNASYGILDFVSNGVKIRGSHTSFNSSGHTFIYMAWAEAPTFNLYGAQSNAR